MRYLYKLWLVVGLVFSSMAHALDIYADALYWQASEVAEWAYTNNLNPTDQAVSYQTIHFNFAPGFRVGVGLHKNDWGTRFIYTNYYVRENESTNEASVSAFLLGKKIQNISNAGEAHFTINFNMFDADLYHNILIGQNLTIRPIIGLRGGWINQRVDTYFQGALDYSEMVTNNFYGLGPKLGFESQWMFYQKNEVQYSLAADFSSSYMWGRWSINDSLTESTTPIIYTLNIGKRDFGAVTVQGLLGIKVEYKNYLVKIGYEVSDWFNQYQVFDDSTGARNNDLILQGVTLAFKYRW